MTHDEVVMEIIRRASKAGIRSHYCKSSERCLGDRGLPDLLLVGAHAVGWIEIKTAGCPTLSTHQTGWRYGLIAAGQVYEIMTEADLAPGGAVDMFLSFLATGSV